MSNPNIPQPQDQSHDPLIGKQFQGYQFKARLGQGTFGVVYLAQHPRLNKEVAVKYLEPRSPQEARTVKKEVDLMAELSHPRIVRIEDHYLEDTPETAQEQKHRHWIMMQYVSGGSLRRMMKDLKRLDMRMTVTVLDQMAAALDFLHGREYIHLDLKPENILVESAPGMDVPNFFLADFGVAQLARRQLASPAGTPVYMSPEQFAANSSPDRRADVYALGVILYELVVGFPPFRAATVNELAFQHSNAQPPSPTKVVAGLSEPVSEVILRALQKQPEARFGTAGELSAALRLAAGGEGQAASAVARDMQRMAGSYAEQVRAYSQRGTALHLFMMGADGVERPQSFLKSAVVLGSDPRVDLPLNDPNIAPQQVRVEWQPDGSLTVTDLVGNGITYLDDRALPPGQPVNWGFGQYLMVRGFMLRAGIEAGQELSPRQFANLLNKVQERYRKPRIQMLVTPEVVQVRVGRPQYLRVAIKPEFAS
ncbi:MAG: protein kinase, partial [Anaerolineae bacterium]|nr:protein kinase [Anaerolineae bacterium]